MLQNAYMTHCLEAGAANTTALIVTSAFAKDIEAWIFAGVSIRVFSQRSFTL